MPSSRGTFPTQGSNPCFLWFLHCRRILYHSATGEAQDPLAPPPPCPAFPLGAPHPLPSYPAPVHFLDVALLHRSLTRLPTLHPPQENTSQTTGVSGVPEGGTGSPLPLD